MPVTSRSLRVDQDGLFTDAEHAVLATCFRQRETADAARIAVGDALAQSTQAKVRSLCPDSAAARPSERAQDLSAVIRTIRLWGPAPCPWHSARHLED
jgi:hypothetical protein